MCTCNYFWHIHVNQAIMTNVNSPKKVSPHLEKFVYFKNRRHKNNSVCLAICICVLALIWYLICEKWVWNNKVLDIRSTLSRIRKVAVLKSRTRSRLSCRCHPGSSNTRIFFYLASRKESIPSRIFFYLASRKESIPSSLSAFYFGINPKPKGSFSDEFPRIQQPAIPPPICWGTRPMSSKGKVTLQLK